MGVLFITGAGGFIGRALVPHLLAAGHWQIKALVRRPNEGVETPNRLTLVFGDLRDAGTYRASLEGVHTVIHLAAVTGKAAWSQYEQTNIEGTKTLLRACEEAGTRRFLFVSTIAVKYADRHYAYARSKAQAEELVRASIFPYSIIRPTIVIGQESPIWRALQGFAKLPIIPLPNAGRVQFQPIEIEDLVRGIEIVVSEGRFERETLELGGPTCISFADFINLTRKRLDGKKPRLIHFPLRPIRALLAIMEPFLRSVLPVTAGQLAVLENDSTASPNWLHDRIKGQMRSTEEAIAALVVGKISMDAGADSKDSIAAHGARSIIDRECDVFGRYLVSQDQRITSVNNMKQPSSDATSPTTLNFRPSNADR